MSLDRNFAGVTCRQVLDRLSDYLDGELAADERTQVDGHLALCTECLRFGEAVGAMVRAVRAHGAGEVPDGVGARLWARLGEET